MKISQIIEALENFAPLPLQEGYDNAGLQIGITGSECSGALLCLDVTESVVDEAHRRDCNLIIAHHPILFKPLRTIADGTQVERVARRAIELGIAIYAAHTNLDNARDGVNFEIAQRIGLQNLKFLEAHPTADAGSGIIGNLPEAIDAIHFLQRLKQIFAVESLQYAPAQQRELKTIAICGGAGDFLIEKAARAGADLFVTGEIGYHRFFGHENQLWLAAIGHYQSEQYTSQLFEKILAQRCPELPCHTTKINTNPIHYL